MSSVFLLLLNYSHDIATAFLTVSGVLIVLLYKKRQSLSEGGSIEAFSLIYRRIKLIAEVSLLWILIAGVPRTLFYKKLEWSYMAGNAQVVAIGIKHVVMFALVGVLSYYWIKLSRFLKEKR